MKEEETNKETIVRVVSLGKGIFRGDKSTKIYNNR